MGRKLGKFAMLLFKLFLLIQLYCYHNLEVGAVPPRQENFETCGEHDRHNGTYLTENNLQRTKRPARLLPKKHLSTKENKNKNNIVDARFYGPASYCFEISKLGYTLNGYYFVKGKNQTKTQVEVLSCIFKHPDGSKEAKEEKVGFIDIEITKSTKSVKRRSQGPFAESIIKDVGPKRPARLLPLKFIRGKPKNNTRNGTDTPFYGPASSCGELERLGYTLNGLYLVDCKDKSLKGIKIEVIECQFKQPNGSKEVKEERIGFVYIEEKSNKIIKRRHLNTLKEAKLDIKRRNTRRIIQRPARLLPLQLLYGKEENSTVNKEGAGRFYSSPSSCSDLGKFGFTLNGYYLVNGTASGNRIEIALCKFHQPIGTTESWDEKRFVAKSLKFLPLDHGRNESYPLMNVENGKCLASRGLQLEVQTNCNPLTAKRLKFLNDGKQLCDINSARCISVALPYGNFMETPFLFTMLRGESGEKNCKDCWLPKNYTQRVTAVKNQLKFTYGMERNPRNNSYLSDRLICLAASNTSPGPTSGATVQFCNDNYKNQTWSFVSLE